MQGIGTPRIFISHAGKDKDFCDVFVDFLTRLTFSSRTIIYTSRSEFGVPIGNDIFEYLRGNLEKRKIWVFFMLSKNFFDSPYCLSEMGAAWVRQNKCFSILLPGFKHSDIDGVVNKNQFTIDLCDPVRLTKLLQTFKKVWQLPINPTMWTAVQQEYVAKFSQLYKTVGS